MDAGSKTNCIVLNLPDSVSRSVLFGWLTAEDISRLDSALCQQHWRKLFLELLESDGYATCIKAYPKSVNARSSRALYIKWLFLRNVKAARVIIPSCVKLHTLLALSKHNNLKRSLVHLNVANCLKYSRNGLSVLIAFISECCNLSVLNLSDCSNKITSKELLTAISGSAAGLLELNLSGLTFPASTLFDVLNMCPQLKVLMLVSSSVLKSKPEESEVGISGVNETDATTLNDDDDGYATAVLSSTPSCSNNAPAGTTQLAINSNHRSYSLERISMNCCYNISYNSIYTLLTSCPNLTCLDACWCHYMSDGILPALRLFCPRLSRLAVNSCDLITHSGIEQLLGTVYTTTTTTTSSSSSSSSSSEVISSNQLLRDASEESYSNHSNHSNDNDGGDSNQYSNGQNITVSLPQQHIGSMLKTLEISCLRNITDETLLTIANTCPKLEIIRIDGCFNVGNAGIVSVFRGCVHLRALLAWSCPKVTDAMLLALDFLLGFGYTTITTDNYRQKNNVHLSSNQLLQSQLHLDPEQQQQQVEDEHGHDEVEYDEEEEEEDALQQEWQNLLRDDIFPVGTLSYNYSSSSNISNNGSSTGDCVPCYQLKTVDLRACRSLRRSTIEYMQRRYSGLVEISAP